MLLALLAGFLISYLFPARYSSQSLVAVPPPMGDVWGPMDVSVFEHSLTAMQGKAWSKNHIQSMVDQIGLAKPGEELTQKILSNATLKPAFKNPSEKREFVPFSEIVGFYVTYTDSSAERTQAICARVTSMLLGEELTQRDEHRDNTMSFLRTQVADEKKNLQIMQAQVVRARKTAQTPADQRAHERLARNYKVAHKSYETLLGKLKQAETAQEREKDAQGEFRSGSLKVLSPATYPNSPDFPNRLHFALAGMGMGLIVGLVLSRV